MYPLCFFVFFLINYEVQFNNLYWGKVAAFLPPTQQSQMCWSGKRGVKTLFRNKWLFHGDMSRSFFKCRGCNLSLNLDLFVRHFSYTRWHKEVPHRGLKTTKRNRILGTHSRADTPICVHTLKQHTHTYRHAGTWPDAKT